MNRNMKYFGHFVSAVVFFQLLPLIPLWFEYMHTNTIEMDSYILCVSMYCFTKQEKELAQHLSEISLFLENIKNKMIKSHIHRIIFK